MRAWGRMSGGAVRAAVGGARMPMLEGSVARPPAGFPFRDRLGADGAEHGRDPGVAQPESVEQHGETFEAGGAVTRVDAERVMAEGAPAAEAAVAPGHHPIDGGVAHRLRRGLAELDLTTPAAWVG